jgi:hypothetical protein
MLLMDFQSSWSTGELSVACSCIELSGRRYYGKSVPVESLSTDDLRFLNNAEALEDSAYVDLTQCLLD